MNICLIHPVIRRSGVQALALVAAMAAVSCGTVRGQSGLVSQGNGSPFGPGTKVLSASAVRTAADIAPNRRAPKGLSPGAISAAVRQANASAPDMDVAQVSYSCQSCNQGSCNGGCNASAGRHSGYGYGLHGGSNQLGSMVCGIPCNPYWYVSVDGLYMELDGEGGYSLTRNSRMEDFGFEWMSRVTIGSLPNCVNGYEFTFVGPTEWNRSLTLTDSNIPGNLDTNLFDGDGVSAAPGNFDGTFLDPFSDANIQTQFYNSEYWSGEINKTLVGWDVARVLLGGRVIRLEERYGYASQKDVFQSYSDLVSRAQNTWVGVQAGLDLLYPIAENVYTDFRGRAGFYYNAVETDLRLRNQGIAVIQRSSDDNEWAGVFEFGYGLRWQLGPMLALRGGGEVWYITDGATAVGQIDQGVTNDLGRRVDISDDFLFYGGYAGLELRF